MTHHPTISGFLLSAAILAPLLWMQPASAAGLDTDGDSVCDTDEDRDGDGDRDDNDTDDDGIPDYLDPDDDGDGIPTIDEDFDGDGDPRNDDLDGDERPDYLDSHVPLDTDLDGYVNEVYGGDDCDDLSFSVHPGAIDPNYDGRDSNCDGRDDYDADQDGYRSSNESDSGLDCNDFDPNIHPGMAEDVGEVDRDCDGWSDNANPLNPRGGCDCGSVPAPNLPVPLFFSVLVLGRRRR